MSNRARNARTVLVWLAVALLPYLAGAGMWAGIIYFIRKFL